MGTLYSAGTLTEKHISSVLYLKHFQNHFCFIKKFDCFKVCFVH